MYAYFIGNVMELNDHQIVLETNHIGYNISCTSALIQSISSLGEEIKVYTYTNVKEDTLSLFGFYDKDELKLFKMLITVDGIGPKIALQMISDLGSALIKTAIVTGNVKTLTKAKGLGTKGAEHCISDLKNKISDEDLLAGFQTEEILVSNEKESEDVKDAIEALVSLGYGRNEAKKAVTEAKKSGVNGSEELLSASLRYF